MFFFLKWHAAAGPLSQLALAAVRALNPPLQKDDDATEEEGGMDGGTAVNLRWWWWWMEGIAEVEGLENATRSEAVSGMKEEEGREKKRGKRATFQTNDGCVVTRGVRAGQRGS